VHKILQKMRVQNRTALAAHFNGHSSANTHVVDAQPGQPGRRSSEQVLLRSAVYGRKGPRGPNRPGEGYARRDLIPPYPRHHMAKQTWRGLRGLLAPMSHEDYSTHCAMASRATKGVVLEATNSHRVLRDDVRKDQLSVTRCTVHPSHSPADARPLSRLYSISTAILR
jgi:hypothetical protein